MTILKLAVLTSTMWQASVSTMEGRSVDGSLVKLDARSVVVEAAGKQTTVPTDSILKVEITETASDAVSKVAEKQAVELHDGSILTADALSADADRIQFSNALISEVSLARSNVRAVRLKPLTDQLELQWQTFTERSESMDLLVIQKKGSEGLDFLAGNVAEISQDSISFLLDEDEIPVPLDRVFGIIFARIDQPSLKGSISIAFPGGQKIAAESVEISGNKLQATASWQQLLTIDVALVSSVDFSSGRLHYLSDRDPITEKYFGLDPEGQGWGDLFQADESTRTGLSSQWRMSRDRFMNNGRPPLTLRSQTYSKGLCLFPKAKIEYALDREYSRMKAIVGVDDDVAFQQPRRGDQTAVELKISADGNILFQQLIPAIAAPIDLDLPLTDCNTLTIEVDFGDNSSVCDYLDLANAVLIVNSRTAK